MPRASSSPPPPSDPINPYEASWALRRQAWLARRRPPGSIPPLRDAAVSERLRLLEEMLSLDEGSPFPASLRNSPAPLAANAGTQDGAGSGCGKGRSATSQGNGKGKAVEGLVEVEVEAEPEPDGGAVIREKGSDELRRSTEGILLAFRQGRPLKDPLPLSLVTRILYRSWKDDGTIPLGYVPPPPSGGNASPSPAVTPSFPTPPLPLPADPMLATPVSLAASEAEALPPAMDQRMEILRPQAAVIVEPEGVGGGGGMPKINLAKLKGSGWRLEKDVASGSDVI